MIATINIVAFGNFAIRTIPTLYFGLFLFVLASAANEILLNLYALENLTRSGQKRYEPLRMTFSIVGFICGPAIGVLAGTWISPRLPYLISTVSVIAGLWLLYKANLKPQPSSRRKLPNPVGTYGDMLTTTAATTCLCAGSRASCVVANVLRIRPDNSPEARL